MGTGGGCEGKTTSLSNYQKCVGSNVLRKNGNIYTFNRNHTIRAGTEIVFALNDRLVIPNGASIIVEGKLNIKETTDSFTRIDVDGTLTFQENAEVEFGTIIGTEGGQRGIGIRVNN